MLEGIRAQDIYIGTSMDFAVYLEKDCGIEYKENGIAMNPFTSIKMHGANIVRFGIQMPPFSNSFSQGKTIDYSSAEKTKISMQRAKDAGLKTLLTFTYRSFALEDSQHLNNYVAPLGWQSIASDLNKITDSVYMYTYSILDDFCGSGLIPEIVSIGNESVWRMLEPNLPEDQLPAYDPGRSVAILNAGSRAVRDIAARYNVQIKVCFHMMGPSRTNWWLETHFPYGPDFDMIGISLYHGWNNNDYAGFSSLGDFVAAIIHTYHIEFIVMETAQLFTSGGNDDHVDILGVENIPAGYPNPPTTDTQKEYLTDITREVIQNGGSGTLVWGGDWVACDCYVYPDQWGPGSSWENKAFWDFDDNLHDGVNWMMQFNGTSSGQEVLNKGSDFDLFPNPVKGGVFTIRFKKPLGNVRLSVFNLNGKLIMGNTEKISGICDYQYHLPDGKNGIFFLEIVSEGDAKIGKLVSF